MAIRLLLAMALALPAAAAEVAGVKFEDKARVAQSELALSGGREDLARYALGLLLPKVRLTERIDTRLAALEEERGELASKLAAQTHDLEELRARVQAFIANAGTGSPHAGCEPVSEEQIEIELLRRKAQARSAAEAHDEKA